MAKPSCPNVQLMNPMSMSRKLAFSQTAGGIMNLKVTYSGAFDEGIAKALEKALEPFHLIYRGSGVSYDGKKELFFTDEPTDGDR